MNVHLVNPSSVSFGTAVITPRWQCVIAAATPRSFGDPMLVDETLFQMDPDRIQQGDAIGIATSESESSSLSVPAATPSIGGWRTPPYQPLKLFHDCS